MKVKAKRPFKLASGQGLATPGRLYDVSREIAAPALASGRAVQVDAGGAPKPPTATEAARKLADEESVTLAGVSGTGQDGKIKKSDVEKAVSEKSD